MSLVREGGRRVCVFGSAGWVLGVRDGACKKVALGRDGIVIVCLQCMGSRMHVVSKSSYSIFYSTSFSIIRSDRLFRVALFKHLPVIHGMYITMNRYPTTDKLEPVLT